MTWPPYLGRMASYTVVVVLAVLLVGVLAEPKLSDELKVLGDAPAKGPIVGIVGASGQYLSQEHAAGVGAVTISASWTAAEPSAGSFSDSYGPSIRSEIAAARSDGMEVVLDPGMQYAPNWVFSLPGGTRFVNQYGEAFGGSPGSGDEVPERDHRWIGAGRRKHLSGLARCPDPRRPDHRRPPGRGPLWRLRYPDPDYRGHIDSFWAYDSSTQAVSPVPGWKPGTGTPAQAADFPRRLQPGHRQLRGVDERVMEEPTSIPNVLVMLPGWGERPGVASSEVAQSPHLESPGVQRRPRLERSAPRPFRIHRTPSPTRPTSTHRPPARRRNKRTPPTSSSSLVAGTRTPARR